MTKEQILWSLGINLFVLVVGIVVSPLLKRLWERANQPRPLSPQDKGALVAQIGMMEADLEKLNHYAAHPKDIFLLLIKLSLIDVLVGVAAVGIFHFFPYSENGTPNPLGILLVVVVVLFSALIFYLTHRLSDENIDEQRASVSVRIEDAKRKLNTPSTVR
jgi:hypothetical protein